VGSHPPEEEGVSESDIDPEDEELIEGPSPTDEDQNDGSLGPNPSEDEGEQQAGQESERTEEAIEDYPK